MSQTAIKVLTEGQELTKGQRARLAVARQCLYCGGDGDTGPCPHPNALKTSGFRFRKTPPPPPTEATPQRFSAVDLLRAFMRGHGPNHDCLTCADTRVLLGEIGEAR